LPNESNDDYNKLYHHLKTINRGAVLTLPKDSIFAELYIFPLSKSDTLPSYINPSEYNRKNEDSLMGVFISKKGKKRKISNSSLQESKKQKHNN